MEKDFGSIDPGKVANLILTTGDLLELDTEVKHLFIASKETSLDNRHLDLYNKYKARPQGLNVAADFIPPAFAFRWL